MSCSCNCNPCHCDDVCDPANEPLASALNNFITAFFGTLTRTCVNNQVVWTLPCDLDAGTAEFPRIAGEGLACYFQRVIGSISGSSVVKVTEFDTTADHLSPKTDAGDGIVLTILNSGGNEQLQITSLGQVKVTAADTTINYLSSKTSAGAGITLTVLNPGANEQVEIEATHNPSVVIAASDIDWSLGEVFSKTLAANEVFTFSNQSDGKTIVVAITNTAGNFTVGWPAGIRWVNATVPTQTIGANTDVYTFIDIAGTIYGNVVQNMS